jgi:hypothetical protein
MLQKIRNMADRVRLYFIAIGKWQLLQQAYQELAIGILLSQPPFSFLLLDGKVAQRLQSIICSPGNRQAFTAGGNRNVGDYIKGNKTRQKKTSYYRKTIRLFHRIDKSIKKSQGQDK